MINFEYKGLVIEENKNKLQKEKKVFHNNKQIQIFYLQHWAFSDLRVGRVLTKVADSASQTGIFYTCIV